ncbi:MAG: MBL fold metallo-hydrolase [Coriobacteriia bacterium]|nr:MBL fold metallo-hydrolase [Coriobacteriia bacterium]
MRLTMIGHSTLLIEAGDQRIVTDPFFSSRPTRMVSRTAPTAMTAEEAAAQASLVLVSHNHADHCDPAFFAALDDDVPVVAPRGMIWPDGMKAPPSAIELEEWAHQDFGGARVSVTPAEHPPVSAGFVVKADRRNLYFAGDTNAAPFMRHVGEELRLDIAVLPVRFARTAPGVTAGTVVEVVEMLDVEHVVAVHLHLRLVGSGLVNFRNAAGKVGSTLQEWLPDVRFDAPAPGDVVEF